MNKNPVSPIPPGFRSLTPHLTVSPAAKALDFYARAFGAEELFRMPGPDGAMKPVPMNGLGLTGYDNNRKLYSMMWTDSMSTGFHTGSGNLSQDGKTMTIFGTMDEPMTGEIGKMVRYTTRVISPDRFVFEIHEVLYGDPFKVVEIQYTRRK